MELPLLPCAYKELFGMNCPMCGFQRAMLLLLKGDIVESMKMYLPLIPTLLLIVLWVFHIIRPRAIKAKNIRLYSGLLLALILINYFVKLLII